MIYDRFVTASMKNTTTLVLTLSSKVSFRIAYIKSGSFSVAIISLCLVLIPASCNFVAVFFQQIFWNAPCRKLVSVEFTLGQTTHFVWRMTFCRWFFNYIDTSDFKRA